MRGEPMQQQNDEGWTKNGQPQEPEPSRDASFRHRVIAADIARVAHYMLADRRWPRKNAARSLANLARKLNKLADLTPSELPWSDADMMTLLGDAALLGETQYYSVTLIDGGMYATDPRTGASVPAVDPSRSTPAPAVALAESPSVTGASHAR